MKRRKMRLKLLHLKEVEGDGKATPRKTQVAQLTHSLTHLLAHSLTHSLAYSGGGWFTSGNESGARKATVSKHFDDEVENSDANKNSKHFQDNDEIVIIPDLEEDGGDADGRVAQAPRNVHRKIPTLNDLEDEVKAAIPSIEGHSLTHPLTTLLAYLRT